MTVERPDIGLKSLRSNLSGNAASFVVSMAIGIWMTPYLIAHLGVEAYGLVPLATSITSYMAIVTVALSGSVGRFLAVDIARGDVDGANRTFNTSLFASLALALLLVPVVGALAWFGPRVLDVPAGEEESARSLLMATGLGFLLNTVGSNLAASTFARNRFDLQRMVDVVAVLVQTLCTVLLFTLCGAALWQVGLALLAMAAARQVGQYVIWRRLTPELRVVISAFDRGELRAILGMGGWLTVNQVGALLFLQTELLVVNVVMGARAAGLYAPLMQWSMLLRTMMGIASSVLTPTFITHHVLGDGARLVSIAQHAVKMLGLAVALPVGLVAGLSEPLLCVWLGDEFAHLWPLLSLMTVHLCINLAVVPLFGINQAVNKLVWPGWMAVIMGAANVGMAVLLSGAAGWGLYGVALAGATMLTAKNALFTPLYAAHIVGCPPFTFLVALVPSVVATALIAVSARWLGTVVDLASWPGLIGAGLAISAPYGPAAYYFGLRRPERDALASLLGARKR